MRSLVLSLALLMAILLVVGEIAARVFTQTPAVSGSENGMPRFGRIPLMPFRPEAQTVRHWWDVTADSKYVLRDGELGWTIGPSAGSGLYTSNAQGIRASGNHVYDSALPRDKTRIVVVGDSFTHGDESSLEDTWTTQLE